MARAFGNALIFGGTRGIGLSVAEKYLQAGFNVTVASKSPSSVQAALHQLKSEAKEGLSVNGLVCDVSKESDVSNAFVQIESSSKTIDIFVNSAGINLDKLLLKTKLEEIHNLINTNLVGTILTCKYCLKVMLKQRRGSIVNIGSLVGTAGNAGQTVYSATKGGLIGFTKSLAKEVGPKGITANLIMPGFIATDMTIGISPDTIRQIPLQRFGNVEEVAEAVFFLSNARCINGAVMAIDGGLSLAF